MTQLAALVLDTRLQELRAALEKNDLTEALAIMQTLQPPDQADLLDELEPADQITLLPAFQPADLADILEEMDDDRAAELVGALSTATAVRIIDEMEPDEAADLLGDLEPTQARQVLDRLEDAEELRPLLLHADDSAGGLMTSEYLALRRRTSAADALTAIRAWQPKSDTLSDLFVIDGDGRLCGVVSMRQLIIATPEALMLDIMDPDPVWVSVGTDQEACAQQMSHYSLLVLPVVNAAHELVGVITIDDVVEVLEAEATEDWVAQSL